MTIEQIKQAVKNGKTVRWANIGYTVIVDDLDQWFITHYYNDSFCIGLTRQDGTLNGKEEDFYICEHE